MWQVRRITGTQSEKREDTLIDTEALLSNATNTWLRKLDEIKSDARIKNYLMTEISKIKKRIPECQYEVKKIERLSWLAKSFNYTFPRTLPPIGAAALLPSEAAQHQRCRARELLTS